MARPSVSVRGRGEFHLIWFMISKFAWLSGLLLALVLAGCSTVDSWDHQYVSKPEDPSDGLPEEIWYGNPSPLTLRNIQVRRVSLTQEERDKLSALPNEPKQDGDVIWLKEIDPDTSRPGPWKTQLYVLNNNDTNHCLRVELTDHVSAGVKHKWINDEILFVEVWWGHVAFSDFILNAWTGEILYMRDGMEMPVTEDSLLK